MADPRIKRTHAHVFAVVRQLIEERDGSAVTLNRLAAAAEVSRRTLNLYWPTIEDVLAGALMESGFVELFEESDSPEDRLRIFLRNIRASVQQPINFTTTLALASAAKSKQIPSPDEKLYVITRAWMHYFRARIGPITEEEYSCLVGPILFQELFTPRPASDEMIESLVKFGLSIDGLLSNGSKLN